MKRSKFYIVLLIFYFKSGAYSVPVFEDVKEEGYEVIHYNYKGHIDTRPSVFTETIARWTISGDLYTYRYPDFFYVKLDNVKTSIFNGKKHYLKNVEEKPVPPEAEIIQQMFAANVEDDFSVTLHFKENEPLWSINMKKGLYSFLAMEYEKPSEKDGKILPPIVPEMYIYEKSVYGNCSFHVTQSGLVVERKMNGWNCTDMPFIHKTNFHRAPGVKDLYDGLDHQYSKVLTLKKQGRYYLLDTMLLKTKTEYKTSPSALYTQIIEQEQSYKVSEVYKSTDAIDASEFTIQTDLIYEISDDRSAGRHTREKNPTVLAKKFLAHFDEFLKRFNYSTPHHYNIRDDNIFDMYQILTYLDDAGFKEFEKAILKRKNMYDLEYMYLSLIPYAGTNAAVKYLTNVMKTEDVNNNIGIAHKIFATLPRYIKYPNEILIQMEPFINHEIAKFKSLKNSALLSFASTVGYACQKHGICKKKRTKYVEMFHNDFLEHEDYEERMTKLLGLVNMVPCFDHVLMNSITTNTSESSHLRALALVGFKEYLKDYTKVYETYWPIVQKKSEPFEVRVRALDLLLSSKLTKDQFNSIISKYSTSLNDPEERQLANYVLSTLHSIKKTTGYSDYLGELALEALKDNKIPIHPKTLATGYYRLAYTDAALNSGSSFDIRFITNSKTNVLDTIQVTFNTFGHSVDFGTYTLYFKFDGFFDWAVFKSGLKTISEVSSVPELLKLLKEYNFELKSPVNNIHVEIVFFIDNKVVFTRHYSKFEPEDVKNFGAEFIELPNAFKYVTFPILEFVYRPSDIGTPIQFHNYLEDVTRSETGYPNDIYYRSSWRFETWFDIYNPLADTSISSFKYYVDETNILLNFTAAKFFPPTFKWINKEDSYAQLWDHMMGIMVEKDTIKEYCPKCEDYIEVDTDVNTSWRNNYEALGFNTHMEINSHHNRTNFDDVLLEYFKNDLHQQNVDAFPYAGPILYLLDVYVYKFWLRSELSRGSIRSVSVNGPEASSETYCQFSFNDPEQKDFGNSLDYNGYLKTHVKNIEDNKLLNSFEINAKLNWLTDFNGSQIEANKNKILRLLKFCMKFNTINPKKSFNICGSGEMFYPDRRSEILSLLPFEPITGESKFFIGSNIDDEDNKPKYIYTFKEVFSSNNIETELENYLFKKDYEKCSLDSKGLKFTAPTEECTKISSRITEYDNYKIYMKIQLYKKLDNETILDLPEPLIEFNRLDENTVDFRFSNSETLFIEPEIFKFISSKMYHPKPIHDPVTYAYSKYDSGILADARSTCTITPSTVEQFSGKYIPNQKNVWLAFVECYNVSATGLKGRTIDDKHVGFTFYFLENVIEATVKDGKAYVTLNGEHINDYYKADDQSIRIYFLDKDVAMIVVKNAEIYYNTEYVSVRTNSIYSNLLCGECTQ